MEYVSLNLKARKYTSKVLGVIKEAYGLKDRGEALDKFAEMYGQEFVDREVREEVVRDLITSCEEHIKKHGFRKRTFKELDELLGAA